MQLQLLKTVKTELLPLFVLATFSLQVFNLFWQAATAIALYRESKKEVPNLVQLVDGRAIPAAPMGANQRTPEVVQLFVQETLTLMFNTLPGKFTSTDKNFRGSLDTGKKLPNGAQVATASWEAAQALSPDFQVPCLEKVSEMTPKGVFSGTAGTELTIRFVSEPEALEKGRYEQSRYKLKIVGELTTYDSPTDVGDSIPFNKEVFVQTVVKQVNPLGEEASPVLKAISRARQAGLEIYAMRELERENL